MTSEGEDFGDRKAREIPRSRSRERVSTSRGHRMVSIAIEIAAGVWLDASLRLVE